MPRSRGLTSWGGGLLSRRVRDLAVLTTEWDAEDAIYVEGSDRLELLLKTELAGGKVKLEFSYDGVNWHQRSISTSSGSDQIFVPATIKMNSVMSISIDVPIWAKYCRVSSQQI